MKETEQRLAALEEKVASVREVQNGSQDRHSKFITVIFTALSGLVALVAICITILSFLARTDAGAAKLDVANAVNEMRAEFKSSREEMEKKFAALSGEALKKPLIEISDSQGHLDGQVFEITRNTTQFPFFPLFFKNIGDKRTEPLSIQLSLSTGVFWNSPNEDWQPTATDDKDYPVNYYYAAVVSSRTAAVGIAPQETWPLQEGYVGYLNSPTNVIKCKLRVFYGADKPAEAYFEIKFK